MNQKNCILYNTVRYLADQTSEALSPSKGKLVKSCDQPDSHFQWELLWDHQHTHLPWEDFCCIPTFQHLKPSPPVREKWLNLVINQILTFSESFFEIINILIFLEKIFGVSPSSPPSSWEDLGKIYDLSRLKKQTFGKIWISVIRLELASLNFD